MFSIFVALWPRRPQSLSGKKSVENSYFLPRPKMRCKRHPLSTVWMEREQQLRGRERERERERAEASHFRNYFGRWRDESLSLHGEQKLSTTSRDIIWVGPAHPLPSLPPRPPPHARSEKFDCSGQGMRNFTWESHLPPPFLSLRGRPQIYHLALSPHSTQQYKQTAIPRLTSHFQLAV